MRAGSPVCYLGVLSGRRDSMSALLKQLGLSGTSAGGSGWRTSHATADSETERRVRTLLGARRPASRDPDTARRIVPIVPDGVRLIVPRHHPYQPARPDVLQALPIDVSVGDVVAGLGPNREIDARHGHESRGYENAFTSNALTTERLP